MKAILFDFGGTIDTDGVHWSERFREAYLHAGLVIGREAFNEAFAASEKAMHDGRIAPTDDLRATVRTQVRLQFLDLKRKGNAPIVLCPPEAAVRIADECIAGVEGTIRQMRPLLWKLSAMCPLALVSNFYGNLRAVCEDLGISSFFSTFVDSADVGVRKPDPEIFAIALRTLRVEAKDAVVVGDSYDRDIVPGHALGCQTVWLHGRSWKEPAETGAADHTIRVLNDLLSLSLFS